MGRSNKQTRQAPVGARRQWVADRALRPSMRSPGGRPEPLRAVQRDFWRRIASGATTADAAEAVGVSWPVGPGDSVTLAACRRSAWTSPRAATCLHRA